MSRKKKTRGANPRDANLPWYFRSYIDLDDSPNFLSLSPFCLIIGALDNWAAMDMTDAMPKWKFLGDFAGAVTVFFALCWACAEMTPIMVLLIKRPRFSGVLVAFYTFLIDLDSVVLGMCLSVVEAMRSQPDLSVYFSSYRWRVVLVFTIIAFVIGMGWNAFALHHRLKRKSRRKKTLSDEELDPPAQKSFQDQMKEQDIAFVIGIVATALMGLVTYSVLGIILVAVSSYLLGQMFVKFSYEATMRLRGRKFRYDYAGEGGGEDDDGDEGNEEEPLFSGGFAAGMRHLVKRYGLKLASVYCLSIAVASSVLRDPTIPFYMIVLPALAICVFIWLPVHVVRELVDKVKRRGHQSDSSGGKR